MFLIQLLSVWCLIINKVSTSEFIDIKVINLNNMTYQ